MSIAVSRIVTPYATALMETAKSRQILSDITEGMVLVANFLHRCPDFIAFAQNPLIAKETKKEVILKCFGHGNTTLHEEIFCFLGVLVDCDRVDLIQNAIEKYLEIAFLEQSVGVVNITSAKQLTAEQQLILADQMRFVLNQNQLIFAAKVDPDIIGGFIIETDQKLMDCSLQKDLTKIKTRLDNSFNT